MNLTTKLEAFAQALASGANQSDAYRGVADIGESTTEESIHQSASRMAANVNVTSRVAQLKDEIAAKALWTREDSVRALKGVAEHSEAKGAEITGAVKVLNEMHGYNAPVKIEHSGTITKIELVSLGDNSSN